MSFALTYTYHQQGHLVSSLCQLQNNHVIPFFSFKEGSISIRTSWVVQVEKQATAKLGASSVSKDLQVLKFFPKHLYSQHLKVGEYSPLKKG